MHQLHPTPRRRPNLAVAIATLVALVALMGTLFVPSASAKPDNKNKSKDASAAAAPTGWLGSYEADSDGSLYEVARDIKADKLWRNGHTGAGVHVAVIDTGVSPVAPLADPDKVVAVVDLSLEADVPELRYLDTYGHGTHMAGIIAGRSPAADPTNPDPSDFLGIAPDAGLVSVKVGDRTGAVDVSQVVAAIDWVVDHRNTDGLNIRVMTRTFALRPKD